MAVADVYAELVPPLGGAEALLEADACLECGGPYAPAPCAEACPANIDVPGFVGAIANGDPEGAAELIFAENLLGGSCARVCPVETLCEGACVLAHESRPPIAIGALQRYATDVAFGRGVRPRTRRAPSGKRVAVLGAGPAGLACAGALALLGHDVTIYDAREEVGGLVRFAIAPYRQLREPLPAEAAAIARLRRGERRRDRRRGGARGQARRKCRRRVPRGDAMKEIRWHARAGQGAKTASQLLAVALLESGKSVQAFPEYGPERRGAPLRAFTRYDDKPIRRHDSVTTPDVVVVLEPSLRHEPYVTTGLKSGGFVLDAAELGAPRESTNLFMVGAVAGALGEPPLATLQDAAVQLLGRKVEPDSIRAAIAAGHTKVRQ